MLPPPSTIAPSALCFRVVVLDLQFAIVGICMCTGLARSLVDNAVLLNQFDSLFLRVCCAASFRLPLWPRVLVTFLLNGRVIV